MKTIGLIGGVAWTSSARYYELLNRAANKHYGGIHSAKCILYSLDFQRVRDLELMEDWEQIAVQIQQAVDSLCRSGAEIILLCCNTLHKIIGQIQFPDGVRWIHIADAATKAAKRMNCKSVALLGTSITISSDFYREKFSQRKIEVIDPCSECRESLDNLIFEKLSIAKYDSTILDEFRSIATHKCLMGTDAILLGCTELGYFVPDASNVGLQVIDSTLEHALAGAKMAFGIETESIVCL